MKNLPKSEFAASVDAGLSGPEIAHLRDLMRVMRYDPHEKALVIDTGRARLTVREDGTVRIDAAKIVQVSQGQLVLDAGRIDLN